MQMEKNIFSFYYIKFGIISKYFKYMAAKCNYLSKKTNVNVLLSKKDLDNITVINNMTGDKIDLLYINKKWHINETSKK